MSPPFAMPFFSPKSPSTKGASTVLALLCIEVLSSELVFSEPTGDRETVHQAWHQQVVERLAQLGESLGATVERQYQNIAFVAFPQEATPVDALESAIKLVLNLQAHPLPIAQQYPSLTLRFGLTLDDVQQRNPMAAATERSLATAGQLVVSHLVVNTMGQKRYPFSPLEGENPVAQQGNYFVLNLNDVLASSPDVGDLGQTQANPSPSHSTSEEDGFSDFAVETASAQTAYRPPLDSFASVLVPPPPPPPVPEPEELDPISALQGVLHELNESLAQDASEEAMQAMQAAFEENPYSIEQFAGEPTAPVDAPMAQAQQAPPLPPPPQAYQEPMAPNFELSVEEAPSFDVFGDLQSTLTSELPPVIVDPKTTQSTEIKRSIASAFEDVPLPTPVEESAYRPRLQLFDEEPAWPHVEGVTLWISEHDVHTTPYTVESIQEFLPLFLAKGLGLYDDNYPTSQQVCCLLGESGVGSTTAVVTARQQVDAFLQEGASAEPPDAEAEAASEASEVEPQYLTLHTSHYRHRSGHPYPLELWQDVCRALFQLPTEGLLQSQIQPSIEAVLHYVVPETEQFKAFPHIKTLTRFMGGEIHDVPHVDLIEALAWTLSHVANVKPLLLQLENLDTADEASLYVLQILLHQHELARQKGLVWVLHAKPSRHLAVLENLDASLYCATKIVPFNEEESTAYLQKGWLSTCYDACPPSFIAEVLRLGEGRPFYFEEILRYAIQRQVLGVDPETGALSVPDFNVLSAFKLPDSMLNVWHERLSVLPEDVARVLQLAGILGPRFSMPSLAGLLGIDEEHLSHFLGVLWEQGWLIPDVADTIAFRHPKLLNTLRQFIPAEELSHMHAWIYESLSQHFDAPVAIAEPLLAFHAFHAGNPQAVAEQAQAWRKRIHPISEPWLESLELLSPLQKADLGVQERIAILRQWFHITEDVTAEKQLLKREAYEALQAGNLSLPASQSFEMLILLGDEAKEQLEIAHAGRLYEYALGIHHESQLNQHGDFIAQTSLAVLAWLKADFNTLDDLWQTLSSHAIWQERSIPLVPWKLEAIGLGLQVHRLKADSKGVKYWYGVAKGLWETCITEELNPLWIARSQLAYAHYLYDKGAFNAYKQVTEQVKVVLASTPTQSIALHQTLVDYVHVNWLEERFQRTQPHVQKLYGHLAEDVQHNQDKFTPLHALALKTFVGSILAPEQNADRQGHLKTLSLGFLVEVLNTQHVDLALASRQVTDIRHALEAQASARGQGVLERFKLLGWQAQLVEVRCLILENKSISAIQSLSALWEPLASSLMGRVLVTALSLLAHIHHKVAYDQGIPLPKQDAYVKKSRQFAEQAIRLAMQSQNTTLKSQAEELMKFG